MENRFKPGDIVQHFKRELLSEEERAGNMYLYEIVGVAIHSETREKMMVYKPLYDDGGMYVRPLEMIKPVELKQLTGYVHGGTSPLGMTNQFRVIFDECAGDMETVIINGGGGGYLVELALDEFAKAVPYELMPLKK